MRDFMLIFRNDYSKFTPTPEELQGLMQQWKAWLDGMTASRQLIDSGHRLGNEGRTLKPKQVVVDGPFTESKECIGGYIIVRTSTLDEAAELASRCPILGYGGNVEVRVVVPAFD